MKKLTIIVVGTLASDPYAGMAWMHMQIAVGLKRLGHKVYYFETTSAWPFDVIQNMRVQDVNYALPYLKNIIEKFGLQDAWAYRSSFAHDKRWYGMPAHQAETLLASADLVLNISAATHFGSEGLKTGRLVYFGTDPVYNEIKFAQEVEGIKQIVEEHEVAVSYGENIGTSYSPIPPLPIMKTTLRQPILTDMWSTNKPPSNQAFTTVGNYRQEGRNLEWNGETYYWSKHREFEKFIELPLKTSQHLEVATNLAKPESIKQHQAEEVKTRGIGSDDYTLLEKCGWKLVDGPAISSDPWNYQRYIQSSRGEFSFAKDQNIRLRSGWFSERSACYLAAGRPVVTQDTAFATVLPTGTGLFSFNTMEDILYAFDAINSNYEKHSKAAREIAEEYFKAEKVLDKLLSDLGY